MKPGTGFIIIGIALGISAAALAYFNAYIEQPLLILLNMAQAFGGGATFSSGLIIRSTQPN